jgi:hypothetical protein
MGGGPALGYTTFVQEALEELRCDYPEKAR